MPPNLSLAFLTGSGLALAGSLHCALMCGPVSALASSRRGRAGTVRYLAGRVAAYAMLGAIAGSLGKVLLTIGAGVWFEASLSWLLALTLLAAALGLVRQPHAGLVTAGRKPRRSLLGRVLVHVADDPLLLGVATALLPCAALYGALTAAAALGNAAAGALALGTFALLTGISLAATSQLASRLTRSLLGRRGLACALVAGAIVLALRPLPRLRAADHPPSCPMHAEAY